MKTLAAIWQIFSAIGTTLFLFGEKVWDFVKDYWVAFAIGVYVVIKLLWGVVSTHMAKMDKLEKAAKRQGGFSTASDEMPITVKNRNNIRELSDIVKETVIVKTVGSHGSGFVVESLRHGWLIVTNHHVVENCEYVMLKGHDRKVEFGKVIRKGEDVDIALISFPNKRKKKGVVITDKLPPLGDDVFAVGTPFAEDYAHSVSKGIVSSVDRLIDGRKYIQSDVSINPGNSGGPLVLKSTNEVVGVAVSGLKNEEGGNTGINHFIPIAEAMKSLNMDI